MPGKLLATADILLRITHKASTPVKTVELVAAQVVSRMSKVLPLSPEDVRQSQESDGESKTHLSAWLVPKDQDTSASVKACLWRGRAFRL